MRKCGLEPKKFAFLSTTPNIDFKKDDKEVHTSDLPTHRYSV